MKIYTLSLKIYGNNFALFQSILKYFVYRILYFSDMYFINQFTG